MSSLQCRQNTVVVLVFLLITFSSVQVSAQWKPLSQYVPSNSHSPTSQSQPPKRSAHSLAILEDTLYVFGGVGDTNDEGNHEYDDLWKYEIPIGRWVNVIRDRQGSPGGNPLVSPQHRFQHSTAVHSNGSVSEMIVFGGLSVSQKATSKGFVSVVTQFNDVWRLSLNVEGQETWRTDASVKNSTESGSSVSAGSSGALAAMAEVPAPRSEAGAVVHDGQLYVFGGIAYDELDDSPPVDFGDLWRYDLSKRSWMQIAPDDGVAPPARFSHSMSKFTTDKGETFLVVFSGRHLTALTWSLLGDMWLFSISTQRWELAQTSSGVQRAYTSVVGTDGAVPKIWFFGGYFRANETMSEYVLDDVEVGIIDAGTSNGTSVRFYGAVTDQESAVPSARYNHRAVLWRDCMVIHGGSFQSQLADLWSFNLTLANLQPDTTFSSTSHFETIVYVLAGFVSSLVVALITLIIRWRRIDQRNIELARTRRVVVVRGIAPERVFEFGVIKYKKPPQNQPSPDQDEKDSTGNEDLCPVCLIEFEEDEDVRDLPCKHVFHVACIDEWLSRHSTCPMCKRNLDQDLQQAPPTTPPQSSQHQSHTPTIRGGSIVVPMRTGN